MLTHRGHRLFYRQAGDGEALLLLHGYPTASWGFHKMWPGLCERFRVIAPDLLGSGFSDKPPRGPYDIAHQADAVEAMLASLEVQRVHVLAHAYGCTTAQELLARQIDRRANGEQGLELESVCFINGGLFHEATRPTPTQKLLLSAVGPLVARVMPQPYRMFDRKLRRCFGPNTQPGKTEMRELWAVLRYNQGQRVVPRVLGYLKERVEKRDRWVNAMVRAAIPLCLINGDADPIAGKHVPVVWRQTVPHGELIELPGAIGHYPPLEDPTGTLAAYDSFRARVGLVSR